jgi:hypothetical protein
MNLYWFNWPSPIGGADTKFWHLLSLLREEWNITVIPNDGRYLETPWYGLLREMGLCVQLPSELPPVLEGWAVSLCNGPFLDTGLARDMKQRGLRIAWSSEMMWHFPGERAAIEEGLLDTILYVSPVQRAALEPGYLEMTGASEAQVETDGLSGRLVGSKGHLRWIMTGNYIDPTQFPFRQRGAWREEGRPFTVGRLSRPDPSKFPDNFPKFYERLGLETPYQFRVMGWSEDLSARWCEHDFGAAWDLVPAASQPTVDFLHSLDVLVYNTSPRFQESWGRAVVEAMLTGAPPILPRGAGHHLQELVEHGVSGFLCETEREFGQRTRQLQADPELLATMSAAARHHAEHRLCNAVEHRAWWRRVFAS